MGVNISSLWQNTVFLRIFIIKTFILEILPLISLEWLCYRLDRYPDSSKNGLGKVTFSGKGPMRVNISSLWQNILICMDISYFLYHFHSTASYFLKMSILTSLVGILTQARMGVGMVTFLSKGPMRGQYVFLTSIHAFYGLFSISVIISTDSVSYCLKMIMLITW